MAELLQALLDFVVSFLWILCLGSIRLFVHKMLGFGSEPKAEISIGVLYVALMFLFAWIGQLAKGASYNPLIVLPSAIFGTFSRFLFVVGARIPAQIAGSILGVRFITESFPDMGYGPSLNVDIHRGALIEGVLTFLMVFISQSAIKRNPNSFFMKTWISSVSKLALHVLGYDVTGGSLNPASATGWAYHFGKYKTREHLFVYWLAPLEGTLLALWTFKLIIQPQTKEQKKGIKPD